MIASQIKEKPGTKQAKPETYLLFSDFYKKLKTKCYKSENPQTAVNTKTSFSAQKAKG